jgi:hypothetical protein
MIDDSIRKKIKSIQIYTKRVMKSTLSGDYLSAFRGSGLEFDQLREYQFGDDTRYIDWNSYAKTNKIMVKQFVEERDRTIILAIDVSGSTNYSSKKDLRQDTISQLAATLSFVAHENKDKVGVVFFSDTIEKWIAPNRGNLHVGRIIEEIFSIKPVSRKTSIEQLLRFIIGLKKRNSVVFLISDFIDMGPEYSKLLKVASIEYDFIGIRIIDDIEIDFPDIGLLQIKDSETNERFVIDSRRHLWDKNNPINIYLKSELKKQQDLFDRCRIDLLDLVVGRPFMNNLIQFFHKRIRRQI